MLKLTDVAQALPRMKTGADLTDALQLLPKYDAYIREQDAATRLTALCELYRIYIPSSLSTEIYTKLYLALIFGAGTVHDPGESPQWHGERQGKGKTCRTQANYSRRYSPDFLQALSDLYGGTDQCERVCATVQLVATHGLQVSANAGTLKGLKATAYRLCPSSLHTSLG